jgi:hypothetical protein
MINEVTIRVAPHGTLIGRARRGDTAVAFVKTDDPRVQSDKEERVTTQYKLTVAPNVDIALISAICMCCEAIQSQVKGG